MNRADLRAALAHPNVAAFLRVIREGESGQTAMAYRMRYGGAGNPPKFFDDLSRHPKIFERTSDNLMSSAAGAYQATWTTWIETATRWGLPDFSEQSQDEFAVARLIFRGALEDVKAGRFEEACRKCATEWTSLPGGKEANAATARARATWEKWLAILENTQPVEAPSDPDAWQRGENYGDAVTESTIRPIPSADEQEARMAPLILPLLQVAAQFLPQLAEKFGSGSEVANRNLAAGKVLAEAITTATSSPNLQAAVEKMAADPEAVKAATVAVAQEWPDLFEVGGGIVEARRSAYTPDQVPWWKNPAIIIALAILPLVYMVAVAVLFGVGGQPFSDDIKTLLVTAIVTGALGSITGFFLGSSLGSQSKDNRARAFTR